MYVRRIFTIALTALFIAACSPAPEQSIDWDAAPTASPAPQQVFVTPTPTPTPLPPSPTPTPRRTQPYTIAWISDTQHYSREYPDTFFAMTEYLRDSAKELNLKYIVHTGDIVSGRRSEDQWETAVRAMSSIALLPAGVLAGNHDVGSDAEYEYYSRYFGESQVSYRECYGGGFEDNRGHYDLIDAGGSRLMFLYMGYIVNDSGIEWMKEVIEQHPDRAVIVCTHAYFDTDLNMLSDGRRIHDEIALEYPNVYMVLCGHRYNVATVPEEIDDDGDGIPDRTLYQMICNYQAAGEGGGMGYMMFFSIDEDAGTLTGYTYSPVMDDYTLFDTFDGYNHRYYRNAPESEAFTIPIPWMG